MMPDRELLIEQAWLSYSDNVIPKGAPAVQLQETRRAFYAGAQALFQTLLNILDPGTEETERDLETMNFIDAELKRFVAKVKVGLA